MVGLSGFIFFQYDFPFSSKSIFHCPMEFSGRRLYMYMYCTNTVEVFALLLSVEYYNKNGDFSHYFSFLFEWFAWFVCD